MTTATFGAGCFWHIEAAFRKKKGVSHTAVGYSGGTVPNPTYKQVCSHSTGHAEVVRIEYDSDVISYDQLLKVFWSLHDPTSKDRQGPDIGSQYRSIIFYHNIEQHRLAEASLAREQKKYHKPIVTEIIAAAPFYRAEDYHQCYLEKKSGH